MQKRADAMDMEKSASRFKIFDTARNFGCIFLAYMQFGILHLNRRKKEESKMQYNIFAPCDNRRKCEKYT